MRETPWLGPYRCRTGRREAAIGLQAMDEAADLFAGIADLSKERLLFLCTEGCPLPPWHLLVRGQVDRTRPCAGHSGP